MLLPLVYVSAPYTTGGEPREANLARAIHAGYAVRKLGMVPLVPHIAVLPPCSSASEGRKWKEAMRDCLEQMRRCDVLLMLPGWWESRGARVERWMALLWGIPVVYSLEELKRARFNHVAEKLQRIRTLNLITLQPRCPVEAAC